MKTNKRSNSFQSLARSDLSFKDSASTKLAIIENSIKQ